MVLKMLSLQKLRNNSYNVLIGTPAYGCQLHIDYFNSIMSFVNGGVKFSTMCIGNESLITRARNTIISYFYNDRNFSHLLFLDADMGVPEDLLARLLNHEKDVIGVPTVLKGTSEGKPLTNMGNVIGKEIDLVITDRIGTSTLLLSRKVIEKVCLSSPQYNNKGVSRGIILNDMPSFDVFSVGVVDGEYLSEDYMFCKKVRELGFDVFVDVSIPTSHNGNHPFYYSKEILNNE